MQNLYTASELNNLLNRRPLAEAVISAVKHWDKNKNLVIGIEGKKGSAKSAFVELIETILAKEADAAAATLLKLDISEMVAKKDVKVYFFDRLTSHLADQAGSSLDKAILGTLQKYLNLLKLIPDAKEIGGWLSKGMLFLGLIGISGTQILQWYGTIYTKISAVVFWISVAFVAVQVFQGTITRVFTALRGTGAEKLQSNTEAARNNLKKNLAERNRKILILLDGMERLDAVKTRTFLELLEAYADFPNLVYLVAHDVQKVEAKLEEEPSASPELLRRLVHIRYELPLLSGENIANIVVKEIQALVFSLGEAVALHFRLEDSYWVELLQTDFAGYFNRLSEVSVFIDSLKFRWMALSGAGGQIPNPVDFIALEVVRFFAPAMHRAICLNRLLFSGTGIAKGAAIFEIRKQGIMTLLTEQTPEHTRELTLKIILHIFPQLRSLFADRDIPGDEWQSVWKSAGRICATGVFPQFFEALPSGEKIRPTDYEILHFRDAVRNSQNLKNLLDVFLAENTFFAFLGRLSGFVPEFTGDKERLANLLAAVLEASDRIPFYDEAFIDGRNYWELRNAVQSLVDLFPSDGRLADLQKILRQTDAILGAMVYTHLSSFVQDADTGGFSAAELKNRCTMICRDNAGRVKSHPHRKFIEQRLGEWNP